MINKQTTRSRMIISRPIFEGSEGLQWLRLGRSRMHFSHFRPLSGESLGEATLHL